MISEEMKDAFPKLRKSEQKAAAYMLAHKQEMETISLEELAKAADVSQPTILRMLKAVGYQGFREAKIAFVEERMKKESQLETYDNLSTQIRKGDQIEDVPTKVIRNTIHLLEDSLQAISATSLKKTVEAIEQARRVCIFSVENSNTTASDLVTKLLYLGIHCEFYTDYYLQSISAGQLSKEDVAIGISYTGTSKNTVDMLAKAKKAGAKTIAITNYMDTPLVAHADIVILTSNRQLLFGNDIFSRTIHLAVVDMIYMGLLLHNYDHFTKQLEQSGQMIAERKYEKDEPERM